MDRHAWKPFLQRWSEEWRIAHPGEEPDDDPWLGCPPATEEIGWLTDLEPLWAETCVGWEAQYEEPAAARSLLISLRADAGVVYLDPGDVDSVSGTPRSRAPGWRVCAARWTARWPCSRRRRVSAATAPRSCSSRCGRW
ncbi:hypothetical protein [Microbispora rosea]|uniref:hypothetical protein n=1 Tax=Microbispora rosea TaxID=58117 RepID=UPI0034355D96